MHQQCTPWKHRTCDSRNTGHNVAHAGSNSSTRCQLLAFCRLQGRVVVPRSLSPSVLISVPARLRACTPWLCCFAVSLVAVLLCLSLLLCCVSRCCVARVASVYACYRVLAARILDKQSCVHILAPMSVHRVGAPPMTKHTTSLKTPSQTT